MTCNPEIMQFLTPPLDEQYIQSSYLRNLFNRHYKVSLYFDDEQDGAAIVLTETDDEDSITETNNETDEEDL